MNEATTIVVQALQLPGEVFHNVSNEAFDRITAMIAPNDDEPPTPVFALGLPRVVDVAHGADVPGALALRYQGLRQWQVDFNQNLFFILADLRTGGVKMVKPFQMDKLRALPQPSRFGPEPTGIDRQITTYGVQRFNLPAAFGADWPSTEFAVTAIDYDWVTNTAVVERRPTPDTAASPVRGPSTFLDVATPAAPAGQGLSLSVPASVRPGGAIRIDGSVAVARPAVALAGSTGSPGSSVMVAELLLMSLDTQQPVTVSLAVPVVVAGDAVSAAFSFDLAARPEAANLAGEYQVYLVSGRSVAGPATLTVTPR